MAAVIRAQTVPVLFLARLGVCHGCIDSSEVTTMPTGRVKWFNNAKGYGFILPEDESEDYFVHYSSIVMEGYKTLKAGQPVSFDMIDGPKGTHAVNVKPTDGPGDDS